MIGMYSPLHRYAKKKGILVNASFDSQFNYCAIA